jgi:carbonic anhydrase/acetyltransferase-like protein (isoleucine patch superfamily)
VTVAASARVVGDEVVAGPRAILAMGLVVRGDVRIGHDSAVLENGVLVGTASSPVRIGRRTVFGHRATVVGATVGDLCEIGNGAVLLPGVRLGDGCILGEGTLVPEGMVVPGGAVLVGRPPHVIRYATDADRARIASLRDGLTLTDEPGATVPATATAGTAMGSLYAFGDKTPVLGDGTVLFDSTEVYGDVVVGDDTILGAGVKIIGDSHGPVRIGSRVQILENTVLHLLPDNALVVEDDVVIGPGSMIHGCHLGRGTVVEPAAIVCDHAVVGAESVVRAGACVKQRDAFGPRSVLDGFPARAVATLDAPPPRPAWALDLDAVRGLSRVR